MSFDAIAALGVLLTPLAGLGALVMTMYRKRIADLEEIVRTHEDQKMRMLGVMMRDSEDEQELARELARVISGEDRGDGHGSA